MRTGPPKIAWWHSLVPERPLNGGSSRTATVTTPERHRSTTATPLIRADSLRRLQTSKDASPELQPKEPRNDRSRIRKLRPPGRSLVRRPLSRQGFRVAASATRTQFRSFEPAQGRPAPADPNPISPTTTRAPFGRQRGFLFCVVERPAVAGRTATRPPQGDSRRLGLRRARALRPHRAWSGGEPGAA